MRRVLLPFGSGQNLEPGGSGQLVRGFGCVTWISAYETTGAAAGDIAIYDGDSANGLLLWRTNLAQGTSLGQGNGLHWLPFEQGIYLYAASGSVAGSMTAWVDHLCEGWLEAEHRYYELIDAAIAASIATAAGG